MLPLATRNNFSFMVECMPKTGHWFGKKTVITQNDVSPISS